MEKQPRKEATAVMMPAGRSGTTPETERFSDEEPWEISPNRRPKRERRRRQNPLAATHLDLDLSIQTEDSTGLSQVLGDMNLGAALSKATRPLLIVSIGNPGSQYASTYHSAGHIIASLLAQRSVELPSTWLIRKSTVYMNVSGPQVAKIVKKENIPKARLVVLHDDLERELGNVRVRAGKTSAQGHNGIKSIQQSLQGTTDWWRIAVGVGRPNSRDKDAVADYVLSKMRTKDMDLMRASVDKVIIELAKLAEEG